MLDGSPGTTQQPVSRFVIGILPEAEAEIREAFRWYAERSPLAAKAFRDEVVQAIDRLASDALVWPEDEHAIRRTLLHRFPYTIHYEVRDHTVTVLAVAHQRRLPGYWRDR